MLKPIYRTTDGLETTEDIDVNAFVKYISENVSDLVPNKQDLTHLRVYRYVTGYSNAPYLLDFNANDSDNENENENENGNGNDTDDANENRKDSSKRFIVRLDHPPSKMFQKNKALPLREQFELISLLSKHTQVPVPAVYHYCEDERILGKAFYIMQFVEGRVVSFNGPHLPTLTREDRRQMYDEFARVFSLIHNVDMDSTGIRAIVENAALKWTATNMYNQWQSDIVVECNEARSFSAKTQTFNAAMQQLMATKTDLLNLDAKMQCFIHGDFHINNVIWHPTQNKIVAVVDWECSSMGNPILSLGYFGYMWSGHMIDELVGVEPFPFFPGFADIDLHAWGMPSFEQFVRRYMQYFKEHCSRSHGRIDAEEEEEESTLTPHADSSGYAYVAWCLQQPGYLQLMCAVQIHHILALVSRNYVLDPSGAIATAFPVQFIALFVQNGLETVGAAPVQLVTGVKIQNAIQRCLYFIEEADIAP